MVRPAEERHYEKTLEGRLAEKFDLLQQAREARHAPTFDEVIRSIEVLFKGVPDAYKKLMNEKDELDNDLTEQMEQIEEGIKNARNAFERQYIQSMQEDIQWTYRQTYEEVIMECMQEFNLISRKHGPESTTLESIMYPEEEREIEEVTEEPEEQVEEKPKKKKPHLSKKVKKKTNKEDNFEI